MHARLSHQRFRLLRGALALGVLPVLVLSVLLQWSPHAGRTPASPVQASPLPAATAYGSLPLAFEANHGQTDDQVQFLARGHGYTVFLAVGEAVLALRPSPAATSDVEALTPAVLRLQPIGANPAAAAIPEEPLPGRVNYFLGVDPAEWRTSIPTYAKVRYPAVYPGIDLVYYGNQGQLEYDFVLAPGANPHAIELRWEGADRLELDPHGDLVLHTAGGPVRQQRPAIY